MATSVTNGYLIHITRTFESESCPFLVNNENRNGISFEFRVDMNLHLTTRCD